MNREYRVLLPKSAKRDIEEIVSFFAADRKEYAHDVYQGIKNKIDSLRHFPEKGRTVPELHRQKINAYRELLESYWRILYKIEKDTVIVLAVIDGRRNVLDILIEKLQRK
ncbi:MAG: type II toxin-antitoxin system RelE/ParE family toxin [Spirochaetaceae bacterium]|nr:MAG: type II toxin-antitoxin system RelE/ParE family toxin [Spirochaetaceae bacterium]